MAKPKILVIVGPTASGKSSLAVKLAEKFNGEIISADSRQVYIGLDIGTGKITKREMGGVPHHLLDVTSPNQIFTVSDYERLARQAVIEITARGRLPIISGGTGFYLQALTNPINLPAVKPNLKLRRELEKLPTQKLFEQLKKFDPTRAAKIDSQNRRRLIRALEIARALGQVPTLAPQSPLAGSVLKLGLTVEKEKLKEKINTRLAKRLKQGLIAEVRKLHARGLSWQRLDDLGLEYRYLGLYLQNKLTKEELTTTLQTAIWHYARRQISWFKRDRQIRWLNWTKPDFPTAARLVRDFVRKNK